jgi:Ca2+-binding EF-hand superfamily protein
MMGLETLMLRMVLSACSLWAIVLLAGCGDSAAAPAAAMNSSLARAPTQFGETSPPNVISNGNAVRIPDVAKPSIPPPASKPQGGWEASKTEKAQPVSTAQEEQRRNDKTGRPDSIRSFRGNSKFGFERGGSSDAVRNGSRGDRNDRSDRSERQPSPAVTSQALPAKADSAAPASPEAADTGNPDATPGSVSPGVTVPGSPTPSSTPSDTNRLVSYGSANTSGRSFKAISLPANIPSWFSENDKNHDGEIGMHEWPRERMDEFTKYDINHDGIITSDEAMRTVPKTASAASTPTATPAAPTGTTPAAAPATASAPPMAVSAAPIGGGPVVINMGGGQPLSDQDATRRVEMTMQFTDQNKDGVLDESELSQARSLRNVDWKKYDANRDGKLDKTELTALFKAEGPNMRGPGGMGGPFGGNSEERMKMIFNNADKKKTGKISKEDFPGFWQNRFDEFDTNKDGFVDYDEFKVGYEKFMNNMRGGPGRGGPGGDRGERGDRGNRGGEGERFRGFGNPGQGGNGGFGGPGGRNYGRGGAIPPG